jgi:hypothetical protein
MPYQLTHSKKRLTSSTTRDYSSTNRWKGPKVLKLLQMQKEKWQLNDRQKMAKHSNFFVTFCERTCINFLATGLTAHLHQKIVESGMIANKSPSAIDWTIIPNMPDTSILDKYININLQLNEWEDVIEDDVVTDIQGEMDKTAAQHATLQTTILYIILIFLIYYFLNFTVVHLVAAERAACHAHDFYDTKLQKGNGPPLCHSLSTCILNGNPRVLYLALRPNLTSFG